MTAVEQLAEFTARAGFTDLSPAAREQLKIRVLDSLGCALDARADALHRLQVRGVRT